MTNAANDVRTGPALHQSLCSLIAINETVAFCVPMVGWSLGLRCRAKEIYLIFWHLIILMAISVHSGSVLFDMLAIH